MMLPDYAVVPEPSGSGWHFLYRAYTVNVDRSWSWTARWRHIFADGTAVTVTTHWRTSWYV